MIPKGRHLFVAEGDYVRKGEPLVDGNSNPHEILEVLGVAALAEYLISEVQLVYNLQGVKIHDKHIETIVRTMLRRAKVVDGGDSRMLAGEQFDKSHIDEMNRKLKLEGKKPIVYRYF